MEVRREARIRYKIWYHGWILLRELNEFKRKITTQWYIEEFIIDIKEQQRNLDKIYTRYSKYNIENELEIAKTIEIKTLHDCECFIDEYLKIGRKINKATKWYLQPLIIGECESICNIGEVLLTSIILLFLYLI